MRFPIKDCGSKSQEKVISGGNGPTVIKFLVVFHAPAYSYTKNGLKNHRSGSRPRKASINEPKDQRLKQQLLGK